MAYATARFLSIVSLAASAAAQSAGTIPDYVLQYAPLVYLDVNEEYYPSDIAAQVTNTYPAINFTQITDAPSDLSLTNLSGVNSLAGCTSFDDCSDLYLTSKSNITDKPQEAWLRGVLPNAATGETEGVTSCAVVVTDHGNNTVDAFYMYFYAWNEGIPVGSPNGTGYGNHVGDWEHMAIRFDNGQPESVYYSIHNGGQAYAYDTVEKNGSRPLGFSSKGGHATYPQDGVHVMYAGVANDSTSRGPLWDPVAGSGAWYYTFTPASTANFSDFNGTFTPVDVADRTARGTGPTDWLYFYGRWGDKKYNDTYPGQNSIGNLVSVFDDGPTGPLDKDLYRSQICPDSSNSNACSTRTSLAAASGPTPTQTVTRTSTSSSTSPTGSGNGGSSGTASPSPTPGAAVAISSHALLGPGMALLWWSFFMAL